MSQEMFDERRQEKEAFPSLRGMIAVNGTELFCSLTGRGHPLLLIPGEFLDSRVWDEQVAFFTHSYKVLCYDPHGTGQSRREARKSSHTQDVLEMLDVLNVKQAFVMGLGQGANIALELALSRPAFVKALILVSSDLPGYTSPFLPPEEMLEKAEAFLGDVMQGSESLDFAQLFTRMVEVGLSMPGVAPLQTSARQRLQSILIDNTPRSSAHVQTALWLKPPAVQRLTEIRIPTLLLVGGLTLPVPEMIADDVVAKLTDGRKVVVPDAPTYMNIDQPEVFNRIVLEFLQSLG